MTRYDIPGIGQVLAGTPFESGGIKYPANWLQFATPEELADRGIVEVPPPEPVPPTAQELADYAAEKRRDLANGSTVVDVGGGRMIPAWTDAESRGSILGLVVAAGMDAEITAQWKGADGVFYTLNAAEITALAMGMMFFIQLCFAVEAAVLNGIADESIASFEDVDAAPWPPFAAAE